MNPDDVILYDPEEVREAVRSAMDRHFREEDARRMRNFLWFLFGLALLGLFLMGVDAWFMGGL